MNKFSQVAPQVQLPPTPSYAEKSFLHTTMAAVVVPALQSVLISVGVGLVAFILFVRFGTSWTNAAVNTFTVMAGTFLFSVVYLLRHWFALTIENKFNIDIPGLGNEPEPVQPAEVWIKKVNKEKTYQADLRKFSCSPEQLLLFCIKTLQGRPISRREWTPKENGFSDSDGPGGWRPFQKDLIRFGLVEAGKAGRLVLTEEGDVFVKEYARLHSPTEVEEVEGDDE